MDARWSTQGPSRRIGRCQRDSRGDTGGGGGSITRFETRRNVARPELDASAERYTWRTSHSARSAGINTGSWHGCLCTGGGRANHDDGRFWWCR